MFIMCPIHVLCIGIGLTVMKMHYVGTAECFDWSYISYSKSQSYSGLRVRDCSIIKDQQTIFFSKTIRNSEPEKEMPTMSSLQLPL